MSHRGPARSGLVGAAALLLGLGGVLLWMMLIGGPVEMVRGLVGANDHFRKAESALSSGSLKTARYETHAAAAAVDRLEAGYKLSGPLLDLASIDDRVRRGRRALPHLVSALEDTSAAARGTLSIADDSLRGPNKIIERNPETDQARVRLDRVEEIGELVTTIRADVASARSELEAIDPSDLPKRFRADLARGIDRAVEADAVLADAEAGFEILPSVLGAEGPRTYLLAMQNSGELRGTGGAMLRFADLRFDDGAAELLPSQSVYKIDRERTRLDIPLPGDAWYVAGIEDAQRFGNANWSPDWPLTSELTLAYREEADRELLPNEELPPIDGMIGVDPTVMEEMLTAAGRFETEGGRPITTRKVARLLLYQAYAQFPNPGERRGRLNEIVDKFYAQVLKPDYPSKLPDAFGAALASKHLQVWMRDPLEQAFIRAMDWDAGIKKANGADYLMVVEQNVGGNKLNYYEEQTHTMDIRIEGRDAIATTEVAITNGAILPGPRYMLGDSNGLHRPMINVYVPGDAQLVDAAAGPTLLPLAAEGTSMWPATNQPAEHQERGKKVWSATLEIPPGEDGFVRYDYRVPGVVHDRGGRSHYRLVLQHQPKVRPETLELTLELPRDATDIDAPGWKRDGRVLTRVKPLEEDMELRVSWRN
jgi:Protein of unknown function (DUF4012)